MQRRRFVQAATVAALGSFAGRGLSAGARTPRIAFGGIGIECSTYSRIRARMEDFTVLRGAQAAGNARFAFLKERYPEIAFLPTLVATAVPGGPVARETYEALKAEFLERVRALLPLDGLFLPMHGAMFVEGMQDAEGDWYEAARRVVGPACLLSASYDLHGNISRRVIDHLDMLSAFRTAPHIDREETMARATDMLVGCLARGVRPTLLWAAVPVLMPGERSSTEWEPGKRLWAQLAGLNRTAGVLDVSLLVGYVWADEPRSTASVVVTTTDPAAGTRIALDLARQYWEARREFNFGTEVCSVEECVRRAMAAATRPAILADSGDNPTGGGNGDQATVLAALLKAGAKDVVFAGIADRPATEAAYRAGVGAMVELSVGGTLDPMASKPVSGRAKVRSLLEEADAARREAVVEMGGVTLVLSAYRRPYHDLVDFTRLGLTPKAFKIIVVKSGYLSPELAPMANPSLMALSDGAINQDIVHLPKNRLRVPSYPFVEDLRYTPSVYTSARSRT